MAIAINCPNCEAAFSLANELAGKRVKCQKCQQVFAVPVGTTTPDELPEPSNAVTTTPSKKRPQEFDDDDEPRGNRRDDRERSRRNQRPIAKSGGGMSTLTMVLLGLGLLSCACCGVAGPAAFFILDTQPVAQPPMVAFDRVENNKVIAAPNMDGFKDKFEMEKFDGFKGPPPGFKDKEIFDAGKFIPKGPPAIPTAVVFAPDGSYRSDNSLSQADAINQLGGNPHKAYAVRFDAGTSYQIDMTSDKFDSYLILVGEGNKILMQNDDGGGYPHARITFKADKTEQYRIEATRFGVGQGNFTLTIKRAGGDKK